ncbi:MAG: translocation/assembly module TamB domain-containing protein [Bacteroidaceae bacterium]|nr:translocation/assembly module TamB domain-containing protein [Bacteroidaceae bacterium]
MSEKLETKVEIGNITPGFLNRIILNDLTLNDRQGVQMLKVSRISASINYLELMRGNIVLPTAQLFSPTAILYRDSIGAEPNYQFLVDAFLSDDNKEPTQLNLRINSFILRHANISYDVKNQPHTDSIATAPDGVPIYSFDHHHISLKDAGMNVSIKALSNDSLNLSIKRLSTSELNSKLSVEELSLALEANKRNAWLTDFRLKMPHSILAIESLRIYYPEYEENGTFSIDTTSVTAMLTPADFKSLLPTLKTAYSPLHLQAKLSGNSSQLTAHQLHIANTTGDIRLNATATATMRDGGVKTASAYISDLHATTDGLHQLFADLQLDEEKLRPLFTLETIDYTGSIDYTPTETRSEGKLLTQAGNLDYQASIDTTKTITAHILGKELQLGTIFENENYGTANIDLDARGTTHKLLAATGKVDVLSDAIDVQTEVDYHHSNGLHDLRLNLDANNFNPHALALTKGFQGEQYQFSLETHLTGNSIDDVTGHARLYDVQMQADTTTLDLNAINLNIEKTATDETHYSIESDFLVLDILGRVMPSQLPGCITSMLHTHLPSLVQQTQAPRLLPSDINFSYTVWMTDNQFVHHFLGGDYHLDAPVNITGSMNSGQQELTLRLETKQLEYAGSKYHNITLNCNNSAQQLITKLSAINVSEESATKIDLAAQTANDSIGSNIKLQIRGNTDMDIDLNSTLAFTDSLEHLKTSIDLGRSSLSINDSTWHISPAHLTLCNKTITCSNLRISNNASYINIDGTASPLPGDSIVAELNNMQIAYILDAVNFNSVDFGGLASGRIIADDLLSDRPTLSTLLHVQDFTFEGGLMGQADIRGHWDSERKAIMLGADIQNPGHTQVQGYIAPTEDDIHLDITAHETPAEFLNGFLDNVFNPITGNLTGQVSVVGPLSETDLVGEVDATLSLSLLATDVPYQLTRQHVSLEPGRMDFRDITLADRYGNQGTVSGLVTHQHLSNFQFNFDVNFNQLLAYEEHEFNADKFCATIYANGSLNIHGADGHPMYITANLTPTRGSVFAYDAASPDALVSTSFIEFRDLTPRDTVRQEQPDYLRFNYFETENNTFGHFLLDHPLKKKQDSPQGEAYKGDLYMDFNVNLNEDCEIKLRMDNTTDGYITTHGNGGLTAKYYNKGTLQLFGTYNITRGSYRLYLQDLIYRDLTMQPGSTVEFNGQPFEADIHLVCHHLVNSVPLTDLTATNVPAQNNKVRVNCILDITGNLGNMDFKFDFDILNTNDEVRGLVRSMINSEEEMNTQMIYLLALGRFYPTNMARANSEEASTSAVNSLVSSTISGQINNMIAGLIGRDSNWNFGTGISTGERGWNDLDVEGTLSGRLFNDRLLINGNFGYRDNALTNQGNFIGDFEVKWRLKREGGNMYLKAYNQTNDRYFTKATLNTQGIGLSYMHDFESWRHIFRKSSRTAVNTPAHPTDSTAIFTDSVK